MANRDDTDPEVGLLGGCPQGCSRETRSRTIPFEVVSRYFLGGDALGRHGGQLFGHSVRGRLDDHRRSNRGRSGSCLLRPRAPTVGRTALCAPGITIRVRLDSSRPGAVVVSGRDEMTVHRMPPVQNDEDRYRDGLAAHFPGGLPPTSNGARAHPDLRPERSAGRGRRHPHPGRLRRPGHPDRRPGEAGTLGHPPRCPTDVDDRQGINLGGAFNNHNVEKLGITLNLRTERGKELLARLVAISDVVTENFAAGVMERLGFGYENLKAINEKIVYVSNSGFGGAGPYVRYKTFGPIVQACCGLTFGAGLPDLPPAGWGFSLHGPHGRQLHGAGRAGRRWSTATAPARASGSTCRAPRRASRSPVPSCSTTRSTADRCAAPAMPDSNTTNYPTMAPHGIYPAAGRDRGSRSPVVTTRTGDGSSAVSTRTGPGTPGFAASTAGSNDAPRSTDALSALDVPTEPASDPGPAAGGRRPGGAGGHARGSHRARRDHRRGACGRGSCTARWGRCGWTACRCTSPRPTGSSPAGRPASASTTTRSHRPARSDPDEFGELRSTGVI